MSLQGRITAGYRTDLMLVLLGTWFSIGLFLDAWAHANVPELETFFTPWHAVFYSGFAATAAWISWVVWRNVQRGHSWRDAVPAGYGPAVLALPLFALSGVGDYLWHTFLGIERGLDILYSPTHLGLITSMIIILNTPLRTAWVKLGDRPSPREFLPAALSLAFTTSLVLLFAGFADATVWTSADVVRAFSFPKGNETLFTLTLAASVAVTNIVLIVPLLVIARRFRPPLGLATLVYTVCMLLSTAIAGYANISTAIGFVLAGVVADVLLWWLKPSGDAPGRLRLFAALSSFATWAIYFAVAGITAGGMPSVTEMWTGAPVLAALHGLLLAALLVPTRAR
ncbi:hypothetical protein GCM10022243_25920 [Saccharothrix violaceirubra]|uniref:Uncharacterized protein n=1 Tax=Saccharothrix violaceirubra TaxID=413306 RepID=A0A7W7T8G2_9PSEU|nr:hypothetical protein [Saccharothrix violaceirubra]MBB4967215.1 hypothetical protein [Saccharothrix violaceirubra]